MVSMATRARRGPVTGVFAGGGIRGIALAGAAAGAMSAGYRFARVIGTSAGAMVGSLVAAGYRAGELSVGVGRVPWAEMADPPLPGRIPKLGRHLSVALASTLYRGDRLEEVWHDLLARKGVVTFGDLPPGTLRIVATDITHQRGAVLPDDLPRYGVDPEGFSVARAVRMSAAVPFVFPPVPLAGLDEADGDVLFADGEVPFTDGDVLFADGALAANFPLLLAEGDELPVIGFRLVPGPGGPVRIAVRGPASLARAVIGAAFRAADSLPTPHEEHTVLVEIPAGGDPLAFDITDEQRAALFHAGRAAAARVLRPAERLGAAVV